MDRKQEGTMAGGYRPRISRRGCREGFQFAEAERKFLAEPGPPGPSWGPEIQALWLHCRQAQLGPSWWWGLAHGAGTPEGLQQASSLRRAHTGLVPQPPLPPTLLHTQSKGAFLTHPFRRLPLRGPGLAPNYNVLFIFQSDKKGAVFQTAMKRPKYQLWEVLWAVHCGRGSLRRTHSTATRTTARRTWPPRWPQAGSPGGNASCPGGLWVVLYPWVTKLPFLITETEAISGNEPKPRGWRASLSAWCRQVQVEGKAGAPGQWRLWVELLQMRILRMVRRARSAPGESDEGQTGDDRGLCRRHKVVWGLQEAGVRESCRLDLLLPQIQARGPFCLYAGQCGDWRLRRAGQVYRAQVPVPVPSATCPLPCSWVLHSCCQRRHLLHTEDGGCWRFWGNVIL